jgi:hypothetical protein
LSLGRVWVSSSRVTYGINHSKEAVVEIFLSFTYSLFLPASSSSSSPSEAFPVAFCLSQLCSDICEQEQKKNDEKKGSDAAKQLSICLALFDAEAAYVHPSVSSEKASQQYIPHCRIIISHRPSLITTSSHRNCWFNRVPFARKIKVARSSPPPALLFSR